MTRSRLLLPLCLLLLAGLSAGCQSKHLREVNEDLASENRELRGQLERTRAALDAAEADREALIEEMRRLEADLAADLAPDQKADFGGFGDIEGVEVSSTGGGEITVRVPGDVLFAPGKVTLREGAKKTLSEVSDVLGREHAGNAIRIEGYTDTDPIKKSEWADNLELSLQRAAAVHRFLQEQGVDAERMYAAGFGAARPRGTKAQSRRVEIVIVQEP
jgi:chemotaxis protein MotB